LFRAFPPEIRSELKLHDEHLDNYVRINDADERPEWVYFPHRGTVVSLTRTAETGATVEVGIIGSEGLVGIQCVLSSQPPGSDAVVQISGAVSRVSLAEVRAAFEKNSVVRDALVTMGMSFLGQVSQHAVCNRLHSIE
jgi:hypothetical protein